MVLRLISFIVLLLPVLLLGFWVWMAYDFIQHPPVNARERQLWALAFVLLNIFAAVYYYVTVYRIRDRF